MKPRFYLSTVSVLAIALLVIFLAAWRKTAGQSTQPATHSSVGREKGVIQQPQVSPSKTDTTDFSALLISIDGNGELLLIDAAGRKLGYDAESHKNFQEIEGGAYDSADDTDDDDDAQATPTPAKNPPQASSTTGGLKRIEVPEAQAGEYTLKISTDATGTYSLNVAALNKAGKQSTADFKNVALEKGIPHYYRIVVSADAQQPLRVTRITAKKKPGV